MRIIQEAFPSRRVFGHMTIRGGSGADPSTPPCPTVHVVPGHLTYRGDPEQTRVVIKVEALLDTGCDVTLVRQEKIEELGRCRGVDLQSERMVEIYGSPKPAFDLTYILPGGHPCTSRYGFVGVTVEDFPALEGTDMLLGQDVLNQFIVTFDGLDGTVTFALPDDPVGADGV